MEEVKKEEKKQPLISFVIPCHNDGKTLEITVDSIIDQDYKNVEVIIVPNNCTDNSVEVATKLAEKYENVTCHQIDVPEGVVPVCYARNRGAVNAKGDYLSFPAADFYIYPGQIRIWVEELEKHKKYAFLYAGYKFVKKLKKCNVEDFAYVSEPFDAHVLQTTNYIDGSFPLRRELWEKMVKEDGYGFDENCKSLNDYEFWLRAVTKHGAEGLYLAGQLSFETEFPHAGGLSEDSAGNWLERMDYIKKKNGIKNREVCVVSLGAQFHGKAIAKMLDADFSPMPSFKPNRYKMLYVIGFYPSLMDQQIQAISGTPAIKVVHWVGSDVWQLNQVPLNQRLNFVNVCNSPNGISKHLCECDWIQKELEVLGIKADVVTIPPQKTYDKKPLPDKFTVAVYQPYMNKEFYNPKLMDEIVKMMPEVEFKYYGDPTVVGKKDNLERVGYVDDMEKFLGDCSALLRITIHDGMPISALEFFTAGRNVITNQPIKHSIHVPEVTKMTVKRAIEKAMKEQLSDEARDYWASECDQDKFRGEIKKLEEYDAKDYWERRALSWDEQATDIPPTGPEMEYAMELFKKVSPRSVLDVGCGNGRFTKVFTNIEKYKGIDISEKLIEICKVQFGEPYEFEAVKMEDAEIKERFDLAFVYDCFQHITEKNIEKAVANFKTFAKKAIIIEPTSFASVNYCHDHDYKNMFKVIESKEFPLQGDQKKLVMLVDLEA